MFFNLCKNQERLRPRRDTGNEVNHESRSPDTQRKRSPRRGEGAQAAPTFQGLLIVHEARSGQLGRITPMAQLVSATDSAETHLLPALHDATVLYLKDGQMRIRGFEMVDGAQFGQTWDVKVV